MKIPHSYKQYKLPTTAPHHSRLTPRPQHRVTVQKHEHTCHELLSRMSVPHLKHALRTCHYLSHPANLQVIIAQPVTRALTFSTTQLWRKPTHPTSILKTPGKNQVNKSVKIAFKLLSARDITMSKYNVCFAFPLHYLLFLASWSDGEWYWKT